eukprot:INCI12362.2.p1 GENE.INCI12362.2~~INCI12362.2.p1  ORF type:complete len:182 (+),score=23.21 INCI12362.2:379-924(+)
MNKACALLLLAAGVTDAAPVVGQYGDGNVANDEWDATVVGGDMNTASGKYATIGGGYMNYAKGDYATIAGGQGNSVISNYGSIMGGYANLVSGRFGTVLGGSKNTASGRHSAALGFGAVSSGDYSFTACFTGEPCVNDVDNSIAFFRGQHVPQRCKLERYLANRDPDAIGRRWWPCDHEGR